MYNIHPICLHDTVFIIWYSSPLRSDVFSKCSFQSVLPRACLLAKLINWWKRGLVILVTKKLILTLVELHDHICSWKKLTEGQTSLQNSTNPVFMAVWANSILSSVKTHENPRGICKKALKGSSDCEKQDSLVWWPSIPSIMFEGNQALLITCRVPSQK